MKLKGGDSQICRGEAVFLVPGSVPRSLALKSFGSSFSQELVDWCRQRSVLPENLIDHAVDKERYEEMERAIRKMSDGQPHDPIDIVDIYMLCRNVRELPGYAMRNRGDFKLIIDEKWIGFLSEIARAMSMTDADGCYRITKVPKGRWVIAAARSTSVGSVDWLIDFRSEPLSDKAIDLFNDNAAAIRSR